MKNIKTLYGLPEKVIFCKTCTLSNQRPHSVSEFKHTKNRKGAVYLNIDKDRICDACKMSKLKGKTINWKSRERELHELCDKYRKRNGEYDCLVPGSGGKDSRYQSYILKSKFGMNPLTVTWPPLMYTDYGYKNFRSWIDSGVDNVSFYPNGEVSRKLANLSIKNLLHPFQTFILGQYNYPPKIALKYDIKLIFYGETHSDYGGPLIETSKSLRSKSFHTYSNLNEIYIAGTKYKELREKYKIGEKDLQNYLPLNEELFEKSDIKVLALGYYLKWDPQEIYYHAVEKTGFQPRPFRSQGTYSKYASIDDKVDDLHYYTTFIKYGIGRATYDSAHEIRNKHLTLQEGKSLVAKYDGEFPERYFKETMEFLNMKEEEFHQICDKFRSPHLWVKKSNSWKLRHNVNLDGEDD